MRRPRNQKPGTARRQAAAAAGRAGFTLVEMLVVILIVAILISAVFGGLTAARQTAWRTRARDTARQIVQAWNLHLNDYREFPDAKKFSDALAEGGYAASAGNLALLNADGKIYLELAEEDREHGLKDKWGHPMGFNIDFDYDGKVANPAPEAFETGKAVKEMEQVLATSIAWSKGPNPAIKKKWVVQW